MVVTLRVAKRDGSLTSELWSAVLKVEAARVVVDVSTDEKFPMPQKIKFPITFETFARLPVVASVPELVGMSGRSSRFVRRKVNFDAYRPGRAADGSDPA
jgi:hypothetical protein